MISCPKCGSEDYHESRQCPAFDGRPVCISCCYSCEDYNSENYRCNWHIRHPKPDHRGELYKLDNLINKKAAQMQWYYEHNKPWIAEKIEAEMNYLKRQRTTLQEEK